MSTSTPDDEEPAASSFATVCAAIIALPAKNRPSAKDAARQSINRLSRRISNCERAAFDFILVGLIWHTGHCETTFGRIAKATSFSRSQVIRSCNALLSEGTILVSRTRDDDGLNAPNQYTVPALIALDEVRGMVASALPPSRTNATRGSRIHATRVVAPVRPKKGSLEEPLSKTFGKPRVSDRSSMDESRGTRLTAVSMSTGDESLHGKDAPPRQPAKRLSSQQPATEYTPLFADFWWNYPRREAKYEASRLFEALPDDDKALAIQDAKVYARKVKADGTQLRFVALAKTYLGNRRFDDDRQPTATRASSEPSADEWVVYLKNYHRSGEWNPTFGPRPDQPGCRVPIDILNANPASKTEDVSHRLSAGHTIN
jgi:hypothetical protein